ncbi:hypothetical protein MAP00_008383 [Monascus purpureus]|nr:hypothetical protein MAP00_008383 [Monascus purpureus]
MNLHAELLPNIRQITLYVSIPARVGHGVSKYEPGNVSSEGGKEPDISVSLSDSRRALTVTVAAPALPEEGHLEEIHGVSETLKLPGKVSETARDAFRDMTKQRGQIVRDDASGDRWEYSFRMPLDPNDNECHSSSLLACSDEISMDDFVPWTARDMTPFTRVRCRGCREEILDVPDIKVSNAAGWTWKDLPSGNWAEMMDFWHCHKPDPHDHEDGENTGTTDKGNQSNGKLNDAQNALIKGYGAANRVVAAPATVLVDVASFLVTEDDCKGLKVEREPKSKKMVLRCTKCDSVVGSEDIHAAGWRLFKASVSLSMARYTEAETETAWEIRSPEILVSAQILETVEREGVRRFVLHCGGQRGLLLWIFNPDLRYSSLSTNDSDSTYTNTINSQRAMKVFYQDVPDVEALLYPERDGREPGTSSSPFSLDELELPSQTFVEISRVLTGSSGMLPLSARRFREWRVGLLGRFERMPRMIRGN